MKLLLDEHFSPVIAQELRKWRHDVIAAATKPELRHRDDAEVLTWSAGQRRAVVTEDAADYLALHRLWVSRGEHHFGVVLTSARRFPRSRRGIGRLVRELDALLHDGADDEALRADVRWL